MEIDRREIYRYLGYKGVEPDTAFVVLVEDSVKELYQAAEPKAVFREYPLERKAEGIMDFTCFMAESKNLYKNLDECSCILLFAATLGAGVDLLIRRYELLQMSKAVVMQAAAAAMIEAYCDEVNQQLKEEYLKKGLFLRPRFSPGYGDFSLNYQTQIISVLEAGKRIGLTLTDSCLMAPMKSVTAVIGVSHKEHRCEIKGCEACSKTDCRYRRD